MMNDLLAQWAARQANPWARMQQGQIGGGGQYGYAGMPTPGMQPMAMSHGAYTNPLAAALAAPQPMAGQGYRPIPQSTARPMTLGPAFGRGRSPTTA